MDRKTLFVDVILPLAIPGFYTYRVPYELNELVAQGKRVVVPFKGNKLYSAIIYSVHEKVPLNYQAKYLELVLDNEPVANAKQLELWQWIASYYLCTVGEVMNAALPAGLKLSSETKIILNPLFEDTFRQAQGDKEIHAEPLEN